jgi:hypothetical protein
MPAAPWPREGVFKLPDDGGWMAPSHTMLGAYWHVTWHTAPTEGIWFECSCPAGQERQRMGQRYENACRHVRLVSVAEMADGYPPRPSAPVNREALTE